MKTIAALAAVAALAGPALATTGPHATIRATSPIVVSGTGFEKSARIRVTVTYGYAPQKVAKTVVSTSTGAFTARWALRVGACSPVSVFAVSAHRRASAWWRPAQDCGPPLQP